MLLLNHRAACVFSRSFLAAKLTRRFEREWRKKHPSLVLAKLMCSAIVAMRPSFADVPFGCAPWQGGAFQWVQAPLD